MGFADLSVKGKLLAGFGLLLALTVVVSAVALVKMGHVEERMGDIMDVRYPKAHLANETVKNASEVGRLVRSAILAEDPKEAEADIQKVEQLRKANTEALEKIKAMGLAAGTKGAELYEKNIALRATLSSKYEPLYAFVRKNDVAGAKAYLKAEWIPANNAYMAAAEEYSAENEAKMGEARQEAEGHFRSARIALVATLLVAVAVGIGIALAISGNLAVRIGEASRIAARIATGDLRPSPSNAASSADEVGQLLAALENMRDGLVHTVSEIVAEAQSVAASAGQLSTAAQQVAVSTERQSQSTSSAAAAVEQMTVSIDHVGSSADDASRRATDAGNMAVSSGGEVQSASRQIMEVSSSVEDSAQRIQALSDKVQEIGNITTVIREVADQTNLLALNAAIEAARAGEQGRGFAVVADEVRKLAERTTLSVQEITSMIGAIQEGATAAVASMASSREVVTGVVAAAGHAGESMNSIRSATETVQQSVLAISDALREQRSASTELARNVESIAQMSEENSAAVASVADTARQLSDVSAKLQASIQHFKV
ncbi:MAG TPA: methyl-accepting chemotaxis protein [Rhodocyclaceae bacterium]